MNSMIRPNKGRGFCHNIASLNLVVHGMIDLLFYEQWTDKLEYFFILVVYEL